MRLSLGYTLLRHHVHLRVLAMTLALRYRRGIPEDEFNVLWRDFKRTREAITRINLIRRAA